MRFEFKLPDLAEGMVEGEIVSWLVAPGDAVAEEQPIVEVMTDKATVVISSPHAGSVLDLAYADGDIAEVGTLLFVLDIAEDGSTATEKPSAAAPRRAPEPTLSKDETPAVPTAPAASVPAPPAVPRGAGRALATPSTRRTARELGVAIGEVAGTGPAGRVSAEDVRAFAAGGSNSGSTPSGSTAMGQSAPRLATTPAPIAAFVMPQAEEGEERVKLRGLRRAIHDAMARSTRTAAHFTYVEEIECDALVAARKRLKSAAEGQGVRLTYLTFIAKACLLALRAFPTVNSSLDDAAGELVLKKAFHLGIAAATPPGLVVPVIKHAGHLPLLELARRIQDLGERARTNSLKPSELKGSTFTISSLGREGGLFATPVINHPEVAILGVHKMEPRAVVRDGQIVARTMMNLSLSFDHRVVDGHIGAAFCQHIKRYLEDPELMMLEMA